MSTAVIDEPGLSDAEQAVELVEHAGFGRPERVDREAHSIRGVKVLGLNSPSKNRVYDPAAIARARELYEGASVYFDHPAASERDPKLTQPRRYRDKIGALGQCRMTADGLYADLDYNPAHELAEQFVWDAENRPASLGLSHNVRARSVRRDGREVVVEIERVRSVDIVTSPGTTHSLFESADANSNTEQNTMTATVPMIEQAKYDELAAKLAACEAEFAAKAAAMQADMDAATGKLALIEARDEARALLADAKVEVTDNLIESLALLPTKEARVKLVESLPKQSPAHPQQKQKPRNVPPGELLESTGESKNSLAGMFSLRHKRLQRARA